MSCLYQYYEDESAYYPMLYCKVLSKPCLYRKKCEKEHKFIPTNGDDNCHIKMGELRKNIPNGSYYVRTTKLIPNGTYVLYIELDRDTVIEIYTKYTEFNQNYIYLNEDKTQVSLQPIEVITKKTTKKKAVE